MGATRRAIGTALIWCGLSSACADDSAPAAARLDAGPTHDAALPGDAQAGDASVTPYAAMAALVQRSCAFKSCHGGEGAGKADLNFAAPSTRGQALTAVLNDVPSCEYPPMARVRPFDPEHSWLMVKLVGAHRADGSLEFTPPAPWDAGLAPMGAGLPASDCPLTVEGALSYGQLMPISGTLSRQLPEHEIAIFRAWIESGAPGP